jgi:hypothetical protein
VVVLHHLLLQLRVPVVVVVYYGSTHNYRIPIVRSNLLIAMPEPAKNRVHMAKLVFTVCRRDLELVGPVAKTPRETKRPSDLDDHDEVRSHRVLVLFSPLWKQWHRTR